jgi:hypothetical protein
MNPLELLARTGFLVKGLLYIVIGVLALQVATGLGGRVTGTRGALMTVLGQPFGRTLLLIAAISLFGYAVWRVLQGLLVGALAARHHRRRVHRLWVLPVGSRALSADPAHGLRVGGGSAVRRNDQARPAAIEPSAVDLDVG